MGIHFRGMSSYGMVPEGLKRSLNLSMDFIERRQRLYGYKTLNLLNCAGDSSMLSTALCSHVASQYMPVLKTNFVRVVINGESWGIYANVQQFNKDFVKEHYGSKKGERWKVPGSPRGDGGLAYDGENLDEHKRRYEIKSGDDEQAWRDLIALCRVLNETPTDKLEEALKPVLDVDEALWFLALDVALVNSDGYWTRASDYNIYQDKKGRFHILSHDMNEAFHGSRGRRPGGRGGPPGGFRPPRAGDIMPFPFPQMLELTPEQTKRLAEIQKAVDEKLNQILTKEQQEQMKKMSQGGFGRPGGRGFGPGGRGAKLDPLVAIDAPRKPLRSRLLAVPAFRKKYLENVRTIAENSLDWKKIGPVVAGYRALLHKELEADTRKLSSTEEFLTATADSTEGDSLRSFIEQRRAYLLEATRPKK